MPIAGRGKGYPIPDNPEPEGYHCVRVYVPDDSLYIGAFWQSLLYLSSPRAWSNDADHTALVAAQVWKDALQKSQEVDSCGSGDCGIMDIRQNPSVPCVVQKQKDCSETWDDVVDMRLCVPKMRFVGGVLQQDTTGNGDWEDAGNPDEPYDPRTDAPAPAPWTEPPPGESGECLSAANVANYVNFVDSAFADAMVDGLTFFQTLGVATTILSALLDIIPLTVLTAGIVALYETVIDNWEDVRDFDITSKLTELMKCKYQSDGSMAQADFISLIEDCQAWRNTLTDADQRAKWQIAIMTMQLWGPVGMTISGQIWGITTYDCSGIECPNTMSWDFSTGNQHGWSPYLMGEWRGNGWGDTWPPGYDGVQIYSPELPAMTITQVVIQMDTKNVGTAPIGQTSRYPDQSQYVFVEGDGGDNFRYTINCALEIAANGRFIAQIDAYSGSNQDCVALITGVTIYYTD